MTQPPPDPVPHVQNGIKGSTVNGHAFQAGAVYGDVHFHNVPAPQTAVPVPQQYHVVSPAPARRRSPVLGQVGRWAVALLPLMFGAAAVGGERLTPSRARGTSR
ncbi:hypothetical protein [Lentzea sp. HUAS12]|uniref:hypothetical protein n=1 Tax=Lentzea sp. HUAS12 TaxID=2951806 RepID=UPI00209F610A|nr:hypothetical protein [Lentzea sp. HUAS12]USX52393.1 hypothetical protein ND450_44990 [Lentzea sp. HUAS12]